MHISEIPKQVDFYSIEKEDTFFLDSFTAKAKNCAEIITAIEETLSFIQSEREKGTQDNQNLQDFVGNDAILSGLTRGVAAIASNLAEFEWCIRKISERSTETAAGK